MHYCLQALAWFLPSYAGYEVIYHAHHEPPQTDNVEITESVYNNHVCHVR